MSANPRRYPGAGPGADTNVVRSPSISRAPFYVVRLSGYTAAYCATTLTCIYAKAPNGCEVFNNTDYGHEATARAQRAAARYFGVDTLHTHFIDCAPEKIDMRGLVLIAAASQIVGIEHNARSRENVVDATLE